MVFSGVRWRVLGAVGAAALFFAYAWLGLVSPSGVWSSPDEAAVAFFAQNGLAVLAPFAGDFRDKDSPAGYELGGLVHPRSVMVVNGEYVPSSWTGLPFFMMELNLVGVPINIAWLLIPLAAVAAVFAWGDTVRRWSGDARLGVFAGALLALHPGWWHYTARALHPNVLFVALLVFAAWAMTRAASDARRAWMWMGASGLCVGAALFVRANEAVWVVPLAVAALVWVVRRYDWRLLMPFMAAFVVPLVLMGAVHTSLYGAPWASGYTTPSDPIPRIAVEADAPSSRATVFDVLFPFGVHEMNILRNAWKFHAAFFVPWTVLATLGAFVVGVRWRQGRASVWERRTLVAGALVSAYLLAQYGSWNFHDNPDPNAVTLGTSYIRYWLPVTVWMTVLGAGFLREMERKIQSALERREGRGPRTSMARVGTLVARGFIVLAAWSIWMTMYAPDEGLIALRASLERAREERDWVVSRTSSYDLIIVDRADKYLFPLRSVIVPLRDEQTYAAMGRAFDVTHSRRAELWYWGLTLPPQDFEHLRAVRLVPHNLDIEVMESFDEHTLYRFVRRERPTEI